MPGEIIPSDGGPNSGLYPFCSGSEELTNSLIQRPFDQPVGLPLIAGGSA